MDFGFDTTRWFGRLWLARTSVAAGLVVLLFARYYGNVRFVPVALGLLLFAAVCYFEHGRRLASAVAVDHRGAL